MCFFGKSIYPRLGRSVLTTLALIVAMGLTVSGHEQHDIGALLEKAESDPQLFEEILEEADEQGISAQLLLEARIVFPLSNQDYRYWESVLPMVRDHEWDFERSQLFQDESALQAIVAAMEARLALEADDHEGFKRGVQEAYWLDPGLHSVLISWIAEYRERAAGSDDGARLPMDMELYHSDGTVTSLADISAGKKAVLLDFWATWCAPCIALMPKLQERAEKLGPQGIAVAGLNTEDVEKAERFRKQHDIEMLWLVEPEGNPLSRHVELDSIPRMILADSHGRILYNGHPSHPRLDEVLLELGVTP